MLSKKERLSRIEFSRFFSVGRRFHTPLFTLVYAPHTELLASVVVPKKVSQKAVVRNRIRRRIYAIVRQFRKESKTRGVFIFLTKPTVVDVPHTVLTSEVRGCMQKTQREVI